MPFVDLAAIVAEKKEEYGKLSGRRTENPRTVEFGRLSPSGCHRPLSNLGDGDLLGRSITLPRILDNTHTGTPGLFSHPDVRRDLRSESTTLNKPDRRKQLTSLPALSS